MFYVQFRHILLVNLCIETYLQSTTHEVLVYNIKYDLSKLCKCAEYRQMLFTLPY